MLTLLKKSWTGYIEIRYSWQAILPRIKEGHFIIIKVLMYQEDI